MAKVRLRKQPKTLYKLSGGPLDGQKVWLTTQGTLHLKMKGYCGFYNTNSQWVSTKGEDDESDDL